MSDSAQPLTVDSKGALVIEAMNLMGYDAMALGEQDLQLGVDVLRQHIEDAAFAVLSANVRLAETGELLTSPYTIIDVNGLLVGLIGLTGDSADLPPAFTLSDPINAAQEALIELESETDLVIVLSHLGWDKNKEIADLSSTIDVVISGGMQQTGVQPYLSPVSGAWLAQAEVSSRGHAGRMIGRWDLTLGADTHVNSADWETTSLGPHFADDQAMVSLLRRFRSQ